MTSQIEFITTLVEFATGSSERSALNELLRQIAVRYSAAGVILWRETPWSNLDADPPSGKLFISGAWFEGEKKCRLYDLPLESATGAAVLDGFPSVIVDIADPLVYKRDGYLRDADIASFCTIPLKYDDLKRGALNLYFKHRRSLSNLDLDQISEITRFLPSLYTALISNVRWALVDSVNKVLQQYTRDGAPQMSSFKKVAEALCSVVADVLDAVEVSVFLEDVLREPGVYELTATTWPPKLPFRRKRLRALKDAGLTGWVLAESKPMSIFDLAELPAREPDYAAIYPGMHWSDSLDIRNSVRKILRRDDLPPLAFIAAPIKGRSPLKKEEETLGVIRCCTARTSPYFFGEMEQHLLLFVADQIGTSWVNWLTRQQLKDENAAWQRFVDRIGDLNVFVESEVCKEAPDEKAVYAKALEVTADAVAEDVISDVRHLNDARTYLSFYALHGDAWWEGSPEEVKARQERTFSVTEVPPVSAGARVVQTKRPYFIIDTSAEGITYSPTFEDGRWLTCAPISVAGEIFGVLDIRGLSKAPLPPQTIPITALLAQQLGLYHYLVRTIAELRRQPLALAQSYQDFSHQLRSPILQVHARSQECASLSRSTAGVTEELQRKLDAVRGLAGKAHGVSQSLGLFADLAQNHKLRLSKTAVDSSLRKTIIEMAEDTELISDPERRLRFDVKREGFDDLDKVSVELDRDLLLQATGILLDNASKYSYVNTVVEIAGSITRSRRFRLSVKNVGIPLRGQDIILCKGRGWRAEEAEAVAGEGSGLGLWIASCIMLAHDGELVVEATNRKGETDVLLLFPVQDED